MYISFLLLNLIQFVYGEVYVEAPCPDVKPVKNFDLTRYTQGLWYEIAKYPNEWEGKEVCSYIDFDKNANNTNFKIHGVYQRKSRVVEGVVVYVKKAGTDGIVTFKSFSGGDEEEFPLYILDVDYDKYIIFYECKYDEATKKRQDYAWVDSRTKAFDSKTRETVDNFIKASNILDENLFVWDSFSASACKTEP